MWIYSDPTRRKQIWKDRTLVPRPQPQIVLLSLFTTNFHNDVFTNYSKSCVYNKQASLVPRPSAHSIERLGVGPHGQTTP